MSYESVYVREFGDLRAPFGYACLDNDGKIVADVNDCELKHVAMATGIRVCTNKEILREKDKIKIKVYITNSRVVFLCEKYNVGDEGWFGDPISVGIATAIERGVASHARRRKAMIGHIRYEWLNAVRYNIKDGLFSKSTLTLFYVSEDRIHWLILKFKNEVDVERLAKEIFTKACTYRLAMEDEKTDEEITFFKNPADAKWDPLDKEHGAVMSMPTYYDVN